MTLLVATLLPHAAARAEPPDRPDVPVDHAARAAVVEGTAAALRDHYVLPKVGTQAGRTVRANLRKGVYDDITSGRAFAEALTADLYAVTRDGHVAVHVATDTPTGEEAEVMAARFDARLKRENQGLARVEVLPGNIGYLAVRVAAPPDRSGDILAAAMAFVGRTDALILDLRQHMGGSPESVALLLSYLLPAGTHLNDIVYRDGERKESHTLDEVAGGRWSLDRPVYVLVGPRTASAGEETAYDLQALARGTLVGEVTRGAANPGRMHSVGQGFAVFVPNGRAVNPITGDNWEGTGVTPDIEVPHEQALDVAHLAALRDVRQATDDPHWTRRLDVLIAEREGRSTEAPNPARSGSR